MRATYKQLYWDFHLYKYQWPGPISSAVAQFYDHFSPKQRFWYIPKVDRPLTVHICSSRHLSRPAPVISDFRTTSLVVNNMMISRKHSSGLCCIFLAYTRSSLQDRKMPRYTPDRLLSSRSRNYIALLHLKTVILCTPNKIIADIVQTVS